MGGAVSSGRNNDELVNNLMSGNYIRTRAVERVFRALDRADFMSPETRDQAYKDLAWRNGPLHLSAPCIYSEVMEALELKPGTTFLNIGSGTGYLSTMVGLIIGAAGTSHGVEAIPVVLEYANKKLSQFIENSSIMDEFDFCIPKYYTGNGLCLATTHTYDRVYCGAGVLSKYESYFKNFVKVGGVLVMPLSDTLVQLRRVSESHWTRRNLLNVSFAKLKDPTKEEYDNLLTLDDQSPASLQMLSRAAIRLAVRGGVMRRAPDLREPPPVPPPTPRNAPRRICIPYEAPSDDEELSELHDMDEAGGAHEMNALLSLVLSMGQNRAAGSLRFEHDADGGPHDEELFDNAFSMDRQIHFPASEMHNEGIIVFDVGVRRSMRARRCTRAGQHQAENGTQSAAGSTTQPSSTNTRWRCRRAQQSNASNEPSPNTSTAPNSSDTQGTSDSMSTPEDEPASTSQAAKLPTRAVPRGGGRAGRSRAPPRHCFPPPPAFWSDLSSSEDDAIQDNKRQKLDSGIGEGTASSSASPDKPNKKSPRDNSNTKTARGNSNTKTPSGNSNTKTPNSNTKTPNSNTKTPISKTKTPNSNTKTPNSNTKTSNSNTKTPRGNSNTDDDDDDDEAGTDMNWADAEYGSTFSGTLSEYLDESESDELPLSPHTLPPPVPPEFPSPPFPNQARCKRITLARRQASRGSRVLRSHRLWTAEEAQEPRTSQSEPERPYGGEGARLVRLSLAMKRGIKELPLPHALKRYINYGRCYQI